MAIKQAELHHVSVGMGSQLLGGSVLHQRTPWLARVAKFCLVGGSGVLVDMEVLWLLADPARLRWNITLPKICAAEIAMISNFIWNDLWPIRQHVTNQSCVSETGRKSDVTGSLQLNCRGACFRSWVSARHRFHVFNAVSVIGIAFSVLLLRLLHSLYHWTLYVSNLLAIIVVTLWNFGMNARFNRSTRQYNLHA